MAKCRIAPLNKISTPQMELNAAVLSKRSRKVIGEFTICDEAARRRSFKTSKFVQTVSCLWSQRNSQRRCRS